MRLSIILSSVLAAALAAAPSHARAQADPLTTGYSATDCPSCAEWNLPAQPVRLHGNAYYVGTRGLSAILLTSPQGHVLIDAGLPESAPLILANVKALGFRPEDIRLIVISHAHYDHAGGVAAIQRASAAEVAVSRSAASVLQRGMVGPDDPQYAIALAFPAVRNVRVIADGDTLRVGPIAITAHFTPGHTPGGSSWSWRSCENDRCVSVVYADSQTPVSADGFHFSRSRAYPNAVADFERGFAVLERLSCDVLITPHPGASGLWERLERRERGQADALRDPEACRRYAGEARQRLARRLDAERDRQR